MTNRIHVGNLPFSSTEADLRRAFGRCGRVASVEIVTNQGTGRPQGFAFVEMEDAGAAQEAIRTLDGFDLDGRLIKVNAAQGGA